MTYDQALETYLATIPGAMFPRKRDSHQDRSGRWAFRNVNGFLAYVTSRGRVLNHNFQDISA